MPIDRIFAQIDLDNLKFNILTLRAQLGLCVKFLLVVKADAYGHGSIGIASFAEREELVDYLGVASIEEALQLRRIGIRLPILILGATPPEKINQVIENDCEQSVWSLEYASEYDKYASKKLKIHIAVDTGMSREGFALEDVIEASRICLLKNLEIKGIYSHYPSSDEEDCVLSTFQRLSFEEFVRSFYQKTFLFPMIHMSNSGGALRKFEESDMVRVGLAAYGLYPSNYCKTCVLKPVMSVYSRIVELKKIDKNTPVSYGGTFIASRETMVAVISCGYADGYPRALSNKGEVIVHGKKAPIIGCICMDMFMIDVTDIQGVAVGDSVTLVGSSGEQSVTIDDIANKSNTISYEIICGLSARVPRVYTSEGKIVFRSCYIENV